MVIGLVHIRETRTRGEVLATQRMLWEEVDMVGDNHQVTNLEGRIHTTGSIADEEGLDAQLVHNANGEGYLFHIISLIVVETALHSHDVHTTEFTEDECTSVSLNGRYREVGDVAVRNLEFVSYLGS